VKAEIEQALAPLVGLPLWSAGRVADLLWLQFGERRRIPNADGDGQREVGTYALHVACPWRLSDAERILVGSGDLLTPADPEEEPETFDWGQPGATWLDIRLRELWEGFGAAPPSVERVAADQLGGVRVDLSRGMALELFPNSTPTGHIATEFWRFLQPGEPTPHVVVGTFGLERDEG
jgi:hypothetical protein